MKPLSNKVKVTDFKVGYDPEDFRIVKESPAAKREREEARLVAMEERIDTLERIIFNIHAITGETR